MPTLNACGSRAFMANFHALPNERSSLCVVDGFCMFSGLVSFLGVWPPLGRCHLDLCMGLRNQVPTAFSVLTDALEKKADNAEVALRFEQMRGVVRQISGTGEDVTLHPHRYK